MTTTATERLHGLIAAGTRPCKHESCRRPIVVAVHHRTRKAAALELDPEGTFAIRLEGRRLTYGKATAQDAQRWTNHYATCPAARAFREGAA